MPKSPTERTLEYYRKAGYHIHVVERWIQRVRRRVDLWGFGDLIAFQPCTNDLPIGPNLVHAPRPAIIQATTTGNMAARVHKICENRIAYDWLRSGMGDIWVVGWKRYKKAEDGKWWRITRRVIAEEDFALDRLALPWGLGADDDLGGAGSLGVLDRDVGT